MRVAVLTQRAYGLGALALPLLVAAAGVEVAALVRVAGSGTGPARWRRIRRKARKALAIGPLGALNGVRMRRWYGEDLRRALALDPVERVARGLGVDVFRVPSPGAEETRRALESLAVDAALSLGNGYIPERIFSVPRLGTVNVHHELLPEFRGAQGVIWQLHEGSSVTGFTVHAVDRSIDTGRILLREEVPIAFGGTLGETVTATMAELYRRSARCLPVVLRELDERLAAAPEQGSGRTFTTPSLRAYRRIVRNHERLRYAR